MPSAGSTQSLRDHSVFMTGWVGDLGGVDARAHYSDKSHVIVNKAFELMVTIWTEVIVYNKQSLV
jgi:hypothetical protein